MRKRLHQNSTFDLAGKSFSGNRGNEILKHISESSLFGLFRQLNHFDKWLFSFFRSCNGQSVTNSFECAIGTQRKCSFFGSINHLLVLVETLKTSQVDCDSILTNSSAVARYAHALISFSTKPKSHQIAIKCELTRSLATTGIAGSVVLSSFRIFLFFVRWRFDDSEPSIELFHVSLNFHLIFVASSGEI